MDVQMNNCIPKTTLIILMSIFAGFISVLTGCTEKEPSRLEQIWNTGKITFVTDNNAHCYYIYKDEPVGFEYNLAKAFAQYLVVDLQVETPGWDDLIPYLNSGRAEFIAASLTRTGAREKNLDFSDAYLTVRQFIIVHKNNTAIKSPADLNGKTVHARQGTSYQQRLQALKQEGIAINLVLHKNVPTEELIRRVAEKEIELTVADTNVALLNRRYYPDIRIAFPISPEQSLAWAVRKGDTGLVEEINKFLAIIVADGTFRKIYEKYYANVEIFDYVDLKKFHSRIDTRLPKYEKTIRQESLKYGLDWQLIAAVIYQESHFDPNARSHTGVRGLMQLTRATAKEMGVTNRLDPQQSIRGGVRYLNLLYHRYDDIDDETARMLFALASYNVGYGHVRDAQKIAEKTGRDPEIWQSLRQTLPLLRYPEYYRHTRHGYARGTEPVQYVDRIIIYYDVLRQRT